MIIKKITAIIIVVVSTFSSYSLNTDGTICVREAISVNHTMKKQEEKDFKIAVFQKEIFLFENDTLQQKILIQRIKSKEIEFELITTNKLKKKSSKISGIAILKEGDVEIEVNSEGDAYPVYEYVYKGDCYVAIRIDIDSFSLIKIIVVR
jgi:hypothetical protein